MISYPKAIYILLLLGNKISLSRGQNNRYNQCSQFLETERKDRFKEYLNKYMPEISCLVCSNKVCDFGKSDCDKSSKVEKIPLYENLLEFGLLGEHLPLRAIVSTHFTRHCSLDVRISNEYGSQFTLVQIYECLHGIYCSPITYQYRLRLFSTRNCFQFSMIFRDRRSRKKVHFSLSPSCFEVATAGYEHSLYLTLRQCEFQKTSKLNVHWFFWQDYNRNLDGVLLALPCLAGGYLFDQFTGRILSGQKCRHHLSYLNITDPDYGIDFIFKKAFDSNVDLLFPFEGEEDSPTRDLKLTIKPLYLIRNDTNDKYVPASRESMEPTIVENPDYIGKIPYGCEIIDKDSSGHPGTRELCEDVLLDFRQGPQEVLIEDEEPNAYLPIEAACFFCLPRFKNVAGISLPLYIKALEFGFVGDYFPENATTVIFFAEVCQIEVRIYSEKGTVYVKLYECIIYEPVCKELATANNRALFQQTNAFCVHVSLYFHDPTRVYYSFGFRCWKYSNFNSDKYVTLAKRDCGERPVPMWAFFRVIPYKNSTMEGLPLIVPCSSGGYVVNSETGRYVARKTCDRFYWDGLSRKDFVQDTDFVLKYIHNNSRYLLFPKRNFTIPYPRPLFIREDGTTLPAEEAGPKVLTEPELEEVERRTCALIGIPLGDIGGTEGIMTAGTPAPAVSERTAASGGNSLSALKIPEYIFYFMLLIFTKIF